MARKHNIPAANCFSGLDGYRRLLERKLDAVAIETPPYFHPEQVTVRHRDDGRQERLPISGLLEWLLARVR